MGRKWHTNKTKPKAYEDIIVIDNEGDVYDDMILQNDFGENILPDWDTVVYWQYTEKLFKKELEEIWHERDSSSRQKTVHK